MRQCAVIQFEGTSDRWGSPVDFARQQAFTHAQADHGPEFGDPRRQAALKGVSCREGADFSFTEPSSMPPGGSSGSHGDDRIGRARRECAAAGPLASGIGGDARTIVRRQE